jgi:sensor histidine kinase YesM
MEFFAQRATYRLTAGYEVQLEHYHLVHRLRVALGTFRADSARYLREPASVPVDNLYKSIASLSVLYNELTTIGPVSLDAFFEVQATGYGLDAYYPKVNRSISLRASGLPDYYTDYARAENIAGYIDLYLSRLLGILMKEGEAHFKEAASRSRAINRSILIGTIIAGFLLLGYVWMIANSITRPIRSLARDSERLARGDMDVAPVSVKTHDEVGILAERFYTMSANIRDYIESLRERAELEKKLHDEEMSLLAMGKALREAQLLNLQDQIRPHFLFNALNAIARNALFEKAPATEKLTLSLARLLRSTMKVGGLTVPLGEEMATVQEYLAFQKERFGRRLEIDMRFDESLKNIPVPRFLIQPIVENAVRHGIEPREAPARILVSVRRTDRRLKIGVADSGAGMEASRLMELRKRIAAAPAQPEEKPPDLDQAGIVAGTGIGLANVASRLAILYNGEAQFRLHSRPGRGTIVSMRIPLQGGPRWPGF